MKAVLYLVSVFIVFSAHQNSYSQELAQSEYKGPIVYFELWGSNLHHSVNVEHVIIKTPNSRINLRVGFMSRHIPTSPKFWSIPLTLQMHRNLDARGHSEIGIGFNYIRGAGYDYFGTVSKTLVLTPSIGYRFQKPDGGLFFKFLYTPGYVIAEFEPLVDLPYRNRGFYHMIGISLGYYFSKDAK